MNDFFEWILKHPKIEVSFKEMPSGCVGVRMRHGLDQVLYSLNMENIKLLDENIHNDMFTSLLDHLFDELIGYEKKGWQRCNTVCDFCRGENDEYDNKGHRLAEKTVPTGVYCK